MKKKLLALLSAICICTLCVGCSDGSTTMDGGKDTDGKAGETPQATSTMKPGTSWENGEGAQESAENIQGESNSTMNDGDNAAEDIIDGAGNAAKDIVDGAGNAAKSAADGVNRAVDNMR